MKKILDAKNAFKISKKLREENKRLVLVGGCFDILHIGHIKFLQKAKEQGDILLVMVESDKTVRKLKGKGRPINSQKSRAEILSAISFVDFVILLDQLKHNKDYDKLIFALNPHVIAVTKGSKQKYYAKRQAKIIKAKVITVIDRIKDKSTSKLARLIIKKFDE